MQVGLDRETGKIDTDRIATGIGASDRNRIMTIKEIISELEQKHGKGAPIDEVINMAKEKGLDENFIESVYKIILENSRNEQEK